MCFSIVRVCVCVNTQIQKEKKEARIQTEALNLKVVKVKRMLIEALIKGATFKNNLALMFDFKAAGQGVSYQSLG